MLHDYFFCLYQPHQKNHYCQRLSTFLVQIHAVIIFDIFQCYTIQQLKKYLLIKKLFTIHLNFSSCLLSSVNSQFKKHRIFYPVGVCCAKTFPFSHSCHTHVTHHTRLVSKASSSCCYWLDICSSVWVDASLSRRNRSGGLLSGRRVRACRYQGRIDLVTKYKFFTTSHAQRCEWDIMAFKDLKKTNKRTDK